MTDIETKNVNEEVEVPNTDPTKGQPKPGELPEKETAENPRDNPSGRVEDPTPNEPEVEDPTPEVPEIDEPDAPSVNDPDEGDEIGDPDKPAVDRVLILA